jgi:uncharacterized membrane protein
MKSQKLLFGFIVSPLATSVVISALAISLVMLGTNATLRDATHGVDRFLIFSTILSYVIAIIVGIPLYILSIKHHWRKLWQNSVAGFSAGLGLGLVIAIIMSLIPSFKWMDSYSPFLVVLFLGISGSVVISALWPFIEHNKSIDQR